LVADRRFSFAHRLGRFEGSRQSQHARHDRYDPRQSLYDHRRERQTPHEPLAVQRRRDVIRNGRRLSLPLGWLLSLRLHARETREDLVAVRNRIQRQGKPAENYYQECRRAAVVKIEALTKSFGAYPLFRDLTLEFPQGSLTVIMGASGCGKSTLLRCINFLEM